MQGIRFVWQKQNTPLHGMWSFLLFAGALHVNLGDLAKHKWIIATLATFGVVGLSFQPQRD
jgi:CPA1 family monovalent cation:H+ antiporter